MRILRKSCYCLKLSTGSIIIGAVSLIFYVIVGVVPVRLLNTLLKTMAETATKGGASKVFEPILNSVKDARSPILVICSVCMVVSDVLIVTSFARFKWLLIPFPVVQPIFIVVLIQTINKIVDSMAKMYKMAKMPFDTSFTSYIYYVAGGFGVLQLFFFIILLSYFLELGDPAEQANAESASAA